MENMWYPCARVFTPLYIQPYSHRPADMSTTVVPHQTMPFERPVYFPANEAVGYQDRPLKNVRKLMLMKYLFDLVKINKVLDLTNAKLHGWYLSLLPEDMKLIQDEGGLIHFLQCHPALEVSGQFAYVKTHVMDNWLSQSETDLTSKLKKSRQHTSYGVSQHPNYGAACVTPGQNCQLFGTPTINQDKNEAEVKISHESLPNNMEEEKNMAKPETPKGACGDGSLVEVIRHLSANISLDTKFKMQGQGHVATDTASLSMTDETIHKYSSLRGTGLEHTSPHWDNITDSQHNGYSDFLMATKGSTVVSTACDPLENSVASADENCTFPDSSSGPRRFSGLTDHTQDMGNLENLGPRQCASESVSSCKESCLAVGLNKPVKATIPQEKCEVIPVAVRVSQAVDASGDFRACFMSTRGTESEEFLEKSCRDVAIGADLFTDKCEQETQTTQVSTSEKCTITEVYMSDLDILCEEFEKLKMAEEELLHLKDKIAGFSLGRGKEPYRKLQTNDCACDAVQRAKWAELHLLVLQYIMCQQHCLRHFYTSPLGESALQGTGELPDSISQTLKTLEDNFLEMKKIILSGVPLDKLKPLSVDTRQIISATCYTPALTTEAYLKDILLETYSSPCGPENWTDYSSEVHKLENTYKGPIGVTTPLPQDKTATSSECPGIPKEMSSRESWFDAEEELGFESEGVPNEQNSLPCVTDLPSKITELEMHHASEVHVSSVNKRTVTVQSTEESEATVRGVDGQSTQGHSLHVEHRYRSPAGGQGPIKESCTELPQTGHKTGPAIDGPSTHGSEIHPCSIRVRLPKSEIISDKKPLCCSLDKLTNVSDRPTASGTCVPQHYATMSGFDTLMTGLSKRHPEVKRERIVGAWLQLQAKHQGCLIGQPLRAIEDMTSEILTQSALTK